MSEKIRCKHCFGSGEQRGSMGNEDCRPCRGAGYIVNVVIDEVPQKIDKRTKEYKAKKAA